ncbi:MAG: hypothetical protein NVS4B3_23080 [Gemmatimonadaceae bacterium]
MTNPGLVIVGVILRYTFSAFWVAAAPWPGAADVVPTQHADEFLYIANCTDGDGHLGGSVSSFEEAARVGRAHQAATSGHHWTVIAELRDQKPTSLASGIAADLERAAQTTVTVVGRFAVRRGSPVPAAAIGATTVLANTGVCEGSACGVVSVDWTGRGYRVSNRSDRNAVVFIKWSSGAQCLARVALRVSPKSSVETANGAYCNLYSALLGPP